MVGVAYCLILIKLIACRWYNDFKYGCDNNKSVCCKRDKTFPTQRYHQYKECSPRLNFKIFVNRTIRTFEDEFKDTDCELLRCILYYIWEVIGYRDRNKLALFVASSLHNTSFYKIFAAICGDEKYKSRGLLMIKGYDNYVHLTCISNNDNDYVAYPDLLALPRYDTICDTIRFWEERLRGIYTFENMMETFRIESWCENRHNKDIENWKHIYKKLRHAYYA